MDFYLTSLTSNARLHFPLNPEKVTASTGAKIQTFTLPEIGDISFPKGKTPATLEWSGRFPGESRRNMSYVKDWTKPGDLLGLLCEWRDSGEKLRLMVTQTPLTLDVYIQTLNHTWGDALGDCEYTLQLVQAREFKIYTDAEWLAMKGSVQQAPVQVLNPRPEPSPPQVYVVKPGDTLAFIAKKVLGSMSKWETLYANNRSVIGANPDAIKPGQVLQVGVVA